LEASWKSRQARISGVWVEQVVPINALVKAFCQSIKAGLWTKMK
jgi:hypothetical protein